MSIFCSNVVDKCNIAQNFIHTLMNEVCSCLLQLMDLLNFIISELLDFVDGIVLQFEFKLL